jgi:hypothetical protein
MRYLVHAAAAVAIGAMSAAAVAEPFHTPGGPIREGNMCWVTTHSDLGYGYWKNCPPEHVVHHVHHAHHKKT